MQEGTFILNVGPFKLISKTRSRDFYQILIKTIFFKPTAQKKFYFQFTEEQWKQVYSLPLTVLYDTKTCDFQRRFLHRIIPTTEVVSKIGKANDNFCTFCGNETEIYEHVFYRCDIVQVFWKAILQIYPVPLKIYNINLTDIIIMVIPQVLDILSNQIIILAKQKLL